MRETVLPSSSIYKFPGLMTIFLEYQKRVELPKSLPKTKKLDEIFYYDVNEQTLTKVRLVCS